MHMTNSLRGPTPLQDAFAHLAQFLPEMAPHQIHIPVQVRQDLAEMQPSQQRHPAEQVAGAVPFIAPLSIQELLTPEQIQFLHAHSMAETFPLELYMCYRGEEFPPPVTNEDYARFNVYVYEELERYYEALGMEPSAPAYGYPSLDEMLQSFTDHVVSAAVYLGAQMEAALSPVYAQHPHAQYVFDSTRPIGQDGVSVTLQTTAFPPMLQYTEYCTRDLKGIHAIPVQECQVAQWATAPEAYASNDHAQPASPVQVSQQRPAAVHQYLERIQAIMAGRR